MATIVAELFELDALFVTWDGIQPPPAQLVSRVSSVEDRLSEAEQRLHRLRRSRAA